MTAPRRYNPVPPEFASEFAKPGGGWRHVERLYNARTDQIRKWIFLCGESELLAKRKQAMKAGVGG
jgi:hypothetical protein